MSRFAGIEDKSASQPAGKVIEDYIGERDIGAYIDDLWKRIGNELESKGLKSSDINKAIKDARKDKAQNRHKIDGVLT